SRASAVNNRRHSKLVQGYTKLQYSVSLDRGVYFLALKHKPPYLLLPKVQDRVSPTPSRLNHFWMKPYWFPVSRDRIAESELALALPRPSRHFPSRCQARKTTKNPLIKLAPLSGTQVLLCLCAKIESKPNPDYEPLYAFDPEIEKTLHRLRKARLVLTIWNSENSNFTTDKSISFEHQEAGSMENNDRTLTELATPDVVYQPWCIQCSSLEPAQSYELKSSLIYLLPKFLGLEFHVVCSMMRPQGILEDHIKMKAFPFSLDGAAKDWLYLQPVLFNT
ncbi:hypothetical protein CR513_03199, partial [Mucuna pruriens]